MASFLIYLLMIVVFIGIGVIIYLYGLKDTSKIQDVKVRNFKPQCSNGFREGYLINEREGVKRDLIEFYPNDYDPDKMTKDDMKLVRTYPLRAKKEHILKIKEKHKTEIWVLPPRYGDLPSDIAQGRIGAMLKKTIEDGNNERYTINITEANKEYALQQAYSLKSGEVDKSILNKITSAADDAIKMKNDASGKQQSTYN